MKVKIVKVIPYKENIPKKLSKGEPFQIGKQQYIQTSSKLQQRNFTGFSTHLHMICTFPDPTIQYEYGRFEVHQSITQFLIKYQVATQLSDFKQIIQKKIEKFQDIKRDQNMRDFVFSFTPIKKGQYRIRLDIYYKQSIKLFSNNPNQQIEEKRQTMTHLIKFDDPCEINELFVTNEVGSNSIVIFFMTKIFQRHFHFLCSIQFKIKWQTNKLNLRSSFQVKISMQSLQIQNEKNKNQFKLKMNQIYHTLLSIQPKEVKKIFSEKILTIGELSIKYGEKGEIRKRVALNSNNKLIFFKATTVQKNIPKKDIVQVTVRFEKIYNLNFALGDISIIINQNLMEGVKIVKASKRVTLLFTNLQKINLQQNKLFDQVVFSIICLKSGFYCMKGFQLLTADKRIVNFVNDLTLFVGNQLPSKAPVFQNTSVVHLDPVFEQDSLI